MDGDARDLPARTAPTGTYDALVLGAGASGVSLLCHLAATGWAAQHRIAIVDAGRHPIGNRQWAFWSDRPTLADAAVRHTFTVMRTYAAGRGVTAPLTPYRYCVADGALLQSLARRMAPSTTWITAGVEGIEEGPDIVTVRTDAGDLSAPVVFDSTDVTRDPAPEGDALLKIVFTGWEVETDTDAFDPQAVTLFDFRIRQRHEARFVYTLPTSPRRALVELTRFTRVAHPSHEPDAAPLRGYLSDVLHCRTFRVLDEESGELLLRPRPPRPAADGTARVVRIGTRAGLLKPSTGFAFDAIQQDCARLAESLCRTGRPQRASASPHRFAWLDAVFLRAVSREPALLEQTFAALLRDGTAAPLLRFLDESSSVRDDLRLLRHLPYGPFVRAAVAPR